MTESEKTGITLYDRSLATGVCNLALLIGCSGRLAHAVLIGAAMLSGDLGAALINIGTRKLQPLHGKAFIHMLLASASFSLLYALSVLAFPVLAVEIKLFYMLLPVNLMASGLLRRTAQASAAATALTALRETSFVVGLLIVMAIFREPLGYGTVSLPSRDGLFILLASNAETGAIRAVASSAGAFFMIAYLFAFFRKVQLMLNRGVRDRESL